MVDKNQSIDPSRVDQLDPMFSEPQIPTMKRKVIIEAAIPGWHPFWWWEKKGIKHLPPRTIEAQAEAMAECVKAGASIIHTHPRHPSDGLPRLHDPQLLCDIMDAAFKEVDFITAHHTWVWDFSKSRKADYITGTKELLDMGKGNKYVQSALVMTVGPNREDRPLHTMDKVQEGVTWMEANHVKPMFSVQSYSFPVLNRGVFETHIAKWKPYWLAIQMGKHEDEQTFADPWSYLQVINNMSMVRALQPDAFIGIHPAGRNWLPVATMGLLYGAEFIRVGLEDQFYLYPHRDDVSQHASDTVKMIANLARDLGREVATVDEARERIGIKLTSPTHTKK